MNFGSFLTNVVPWIGAAATGNVPALISMAAETVSKAVGKPVASNLDAISAAVSGATPEQLIALKQADNDFAAKMQAMGFEHEEDLIKIANDDRANARARQMTLKDRIPAILAIGITTGFFGLLATMMHIAPPPATKELMNVMLGALGTAWIQVTSYYFGSSAAHDAMVTSKQ